MCLCGLYKTKVNHIILIIFLLLAYFTFTLTYSIMISLIIIFSFLISANAFQSFARFGARVGTKTMNLEMSKKVYFDVEVVSSTVLYANI
jgi:hypothetical protein